MNYGDNGYAFACLIKIILMVPGYFVLKILTIGRFQKDFDVMVTFKEGDADIEYSDYSLLFTFLGSAFWVVIFIGFIHIFEKM